jgi:hypothetical protein
MLRVHNAGHLTFCSDKSIAIEWCILPFKRSRSWRFEKQGLVYLSLREYSRRQHSGDNFKISTYFVLII